MRLPFFFDTFFPNVFRTYDSRRYLKVMYREKPDFRAIITRLVGFADISGVPIDISGAPQDFTGSGWVVGGAGTVGGTYFLSDSWFLDIAYTYARTKDQTFNYFSTYTHTQNPFGTTSGTLAGSSTGKVSTQGVTVTINMVFHRRP